MIAIYVLNRVSSKTVPTTQYEIWHGKKPKFESSQNLRLSGSCQETTADKLEFRSFRARFIGYPKESLGYYFYILEDHNMIVSQNDIFLEK